MTVCIPIHCVIRSRVRKSRRVHKDNMASQEERKEGKEKKRDVYEDFSKRGNENNASS